MDENYTLSFFSLETKRTFKEYYDFDIAHLATLFKKKNEYFWNKKSERKALDLFHRAAEHVPAYKDFLKKHGVRHTSVKNIRDFKKLPITDKRNYIQVYDLKDRSWKGNVASNNIIAVSSGTTGEPTAWPRSFREELGAAIIHEFLYRYLFQINIHKTLVAIGFPMGIYVSGVATTLPTVAIAQKGYPITVISAGNQKSQLLSALENSHRYYDQILLIGHPFFIKDLVEEARAKKHTWVRKKTKMMFCSEGFNEAWRNYMIRLLGTNTLPEHALNTYGSTELLLMGYETPFTVSLRRLATKNKNLKELLFGRDEIPNIFQYFPLLHYVESSSSVLLFTSASGGIPLVRYSLHDSGEIISLNKIHTAVKTSTKKDLLATWQLPVITLGKRSDNAIVFYAVNIYPEHIRRILDHKLFLPKITGKFTMIKKQMRKKDQALEIYIELRPHITHNKNLSGVIQKHIFAGLRTSNMEYKDAHGALGKKLIPIVKLRPYQSEPYFKAGLKPRFIQK